MISWEDVYYLLLCMNIYMAKKEIGRHKKTEVKNPKKTSGTPEEQTSLFSDISFFGGLSSEIRHSVIAILFFVIGIFFSVAPWGYAGILGGSVYGGFNYLLGVGYFALPLLLFLLGVSFFRESRPNIAMTASLGAFLFLFSTLGLVNIFSGDSSGGILGRIVSVPLVKLFDTYIATLFLIAFLAISFLIMFNTRPNFSALLFWRRNNDEEEDVEQLTTDNQPLTADTITETKSDTEEEKPTKLAQVVAKIKEKKDGT